MSEKPTLDYANPRPSTAHRHDAAESVIVCTVIGLAVLALLYLII